MGEIQKDAIESTPYEAWEWTQSLRERVETDKRIFRGLRSGTRQHLEVKRRGGTKRWETFREYSANFYWALPLPGTVLGDWDDNYLKRQHPSLNSVLLGKLLNLTKFQTPHLKSGVNNEVSTKYPKSNRSFPESPPVHARCFIFILRIPLIVLQGRYSCFIEKESKV